MAIRRAVRQQSKLRQPVGGLLRSDGQLFLGAAFGSFAAARAANRWRVFDIANNSSRSFDGL
jgi:hypothetical protein